MRIEIGPMEATDNQEEIDVTALLRSGWIYFDTPGRLSHEMWDLLLEIIGKGNYHLLAMTNGTDATGYRYKRGQFVINAEGQKRMREYRSQ